MPKDTGILGQGGGIAEINAVDRPNDAVFAVLFIQALGLIIGVAPVGAFQNRIVNVRPGHLQPGLDVGVLRLIVFDGSRHIGDGGGGFGGGRCFCNGGGGFGGGDGGGGIFGGGGASANGVDVDAPANEDGGASWKQGDHSLVNFDEDDDCSAMASDGGDDLGNIA